MKLWTLAHAKTLLPALAAMLLLAVLLRLWLGKKSLRVRRIPLQIIAVLLVVLEIMKQSVSLSRGYDLYHLPFHFCSLFVFVLPVMAFYHGKHGHKVNSTVMVLCGAVSLFLMIYPDLIYGAWDIENFFKDPLAFHTVAFHNLVLLAFLLIPALQLCEEPQRGELRASIVFMLIFSAIAAIMAQLLKTNYANMYACNIPPLENIRLAVQGVLGYPFTQVLYCCAVAGCHIGFVSLTHAICLGLRRLIPRLPQ